MTSSLKIVVVLGLVAGFVAGIVQYVSALAAPAFGLTVYWPFPGALIKNVVVYCVSLNLIFGLIYAIIFSKAYAAIPGGRVSKGFCFGLVLFLFSPVRDDFFMIAYGMPIAFEIWWLFVMFFPSIVYGTLLGTLYKGEVEPTGKFVFGKGFQLGAVAGLLGGTAAFLTAIPVNLWIWGLKPEAVAIMSQAVNHITLNGLWGAVFGIVYTRVFDLVPRKGALKGLVYGLTIFLMATGHGSTYSFVSGEFAWVIWANVIAVVQFIVFGLVLGALYKKQ